MCSILIPSPVKVFLLFPKNFLDRASLKNYGKNMKNFPVSKKFDAKYSADEKFQKYNLRTPQAVVSHQSTQSTRRSAKTLGTRPAAGLWSTQVIVALVILDSLACSIAA
jgi:hypothetical protein